MTAQELAKEYIELYSEKIALNQKPEKPPERPCPRCAGVQEWTYEISWPEGRMIVAEGYHLCESHSEEYDSEQELYFFG